MSRGLGLDLGRANVRFAALDSKKGVTTLTRYRSAELDPGESPHAVASEVFGPLKPRPSGVRVGVTGADIMLRYLPVPEVEDWRLERLMDFEVRELESRSGSGLATSYNLLPVPRELDDEDTMLLTASVAAFCKGFALLAEEESLKYIVATSKRLPFNFSGWLPNSFLRVPVNFTIRSVCVPDAPYKVELT